MRSDTHPISGALYEEMGDGLVKITKDDLSGIFHWETGYVKGDIVTPDVHYLQHIGGPQLVNSSLEEIAKEAGDKANDSYHGTVRDPRRTATGRVMFQNEGVPAVAKYVGDPGRMTDTGMRSAGPTFQELVEGDSHPELVPETLKEDSPLPGGVMKVSTDRLYTQEYHDLEVERLWKRVWQFACREDDIPEVGDYLVYDIAHLSYIVVRVDATTFKAYNNVCLHRGRQLREYDGKNATEFRCPFHGWSWEIDGSLREIPSEWDFPEVREEAEHLVDAQVGTWGGFVFINPDPNCEPLEDFLGSLPEHYERWNFEDRVKISHVAKIVRANWKLTQEAFCEGYHVMATHPQSMVGGGDGSNMSYDAFGNWCRATATGSGGTSPQRGLYPPIEEIFAGRKAGADNIREALRPVMGDKADDFCDAELVDGYFNNLFPNFHPWGAFSRIVYRFRPYGDDPTMSIMEVMYLVPWPEGQPKPPPVPIHWLGPDEPFTEAEEMGELGRVLNQDTYNLPKIQKGVKAKAQPTIFLSSYAESKVRHFHNLYDEWMSVE